MTDNLYNGSRLTAHEVDSVQFSIIVPVYNCEKYLNKCLDSLCNQDIYTLTNSQNYEIIIVDDGSTDKSPEICDSYAEKFSFIHVTHTENHGASHARNTALKQCQGNYIMFCDSDDFVSPQLISVMTRAVELDNKADMLLFKHFRVIEFNNKDWPVYDINNMKISDWTYPTSKELCYSVIQDDSVGGYLWNKVFKRNLTQNQYFNENIKVLDDQGWVLELLCNHENMRICNTQYFLYCYVQHSDYGQARVITNTYDKNGKSWWITCMESELNINGLPPRLIEQRKGDIYMLSLGNLRRHPLGLSEQARTHLRDNIKKYFAVFYLSPTHSLVEKLKSFVKHVLIILRINK